MDPNKPLKEFTKEEWGKFLFAEGIEKGYKVFSSNEWLTYDGIIHRFNRLWLNRDVTTLKPKLQQEINSLLIESECNACYGQRLNPLILSSKINNLSIGDYMNLEITDLINELSSLKSDIGGKLIQQIIKSLQSLEDVGLEYLTLGRSSLNISGGEGQRLKLVKHLGSSLTDMTFILDEPSVGLHPKDIERLNKLLRFLKEKGNSVLVVEHNRDIIKLADHIIDLGPLAGSEGGNIVYQGNYKGLLESNTVTGKILNRKIVVKNPHNKGLSYFNFTSGPVHNLKSLDIRIPKNVLTVISGVAGSGKSTLLTEVIKKQYSETILINQKLIGVSSRSTPATYTKIMDIIRNLYSKENNVDKGMFSFNSIGACPVCKGKGQIVPDMVFADPVSITCESCKGKRYSEEALSYTYKEKNISDILELTIMEALSFFDQVTIKNRLELLYQIGLGYLTLGQPLSTLSGGEKQRIKISSELSKTSQLYLMDEPTAGLHIHDVELLLQLIQQLVDNGNTVILAEHHLDVIAYADWNIDLGPEGGKNGGKILFQGHVEELINCKESYTGQYLKERL